MPCEPPPAGPAAIFPASVGVQQAVGALVRRWSSIGPVGQPLPAVVEHVQRATRAIYREVFAL